MQVNIVVILLFTSFLISLLVTAAIKHAFGHSWLDVPNPRSAHSRPTPRGGGLGFILAGAITQWLAPLNSSLADSGWSIAWLVLVPLIVIGILEDWRGVPASIRYLVHLITAGLIVICFGPFPQPWLADWGPLGLAIANLLSVIGISALINFYNFMDGLDGLVAGVSAVQLGFLALWLHQPALGLIVAALAGFLYWNWSPAKIFMGDTGSTTLGAVVAIALLRSGGSMQGWSALPVSLTIVGDATYTLIRRLLRGENIFKAHRHHLYQRLQQAGWSHAQVAVTYLLGTLLLAIGVWAFGLAGNWISLLGMGIAIVVGEFYLGSRSAG